MNVCLLTVAPLAEGWRLSVDELANDMVFKSGRAAEGAARRLALRLSRAGIPAEVRIQLRDHSTAARFVCPPVGANDPGIAVDLPPSGARRVLEAA
jgi:hypothetical protein